EEAQRVLGLDMPPKVIEQGDLVVSLLHPFSFELKRRLAIHVEIEIEAVPKIRRIRLLGVHPSFRTPHPPKRDRIGRVSWLPKNRLAKMAMSFCGRLRIRVVLVAVDLKGRHEEPSLIYTARPLVLGQHFERLAAVHLLYLVVTLLTNSFQYQA